MKILIIRSSSGQCESCVQSVSDVHLSEAPKRSAQQHWKRGKLYRSLISKKTKMVEYKVQFVLLNARINLLIDTITSATYSQLVTWARSYHLYQDHVNPL